MSQLSVKEKELALDLDKIPTRALELAYWFRRLPSGFRFYMEVLYRDLMLTKPCNTYLHAADLFEKLRNQRDAELRLLPSKPYLHWLRTKTPPEVLPKQRKISDPARNPQEALPKQRKIYAAEEVLEQHNCYYCAAENPPEDLERLSYAAAEEVLLQRMISYTSEIGFSTDNLSGEVPEERKISCDAESLPEALEQRWISNTAGNRPDSLEMRKISYDADSLPEALEQRWISYTAGNRPDSLEMRKISYAAGNQPEDLEESRIPYAAGNRPEDLEESRISYAAGNRPEDLQESRIPYAAGNRPEDLQESRILYAARNLPEDLEECRISHAARNRPEDLEEFRISYAAGRTAEKVLLKRMISNLAAASREAGISLEEFEQCRISGSHAVRSPQEGVHEQRNDPYEAGNPPAPHLEQRYDHDAAGPSPFIRCAGCGRCMRHCQGDSSIELHSGRPRDPHVHIPPASNTHAQQARPQQQHSPPPSDPPSSKTAATRKTRTPTSNVLVPCTRWQQSTTPQSNTPQQQNRSPPPVPCPSPGVSTTSGETPTTSTPPIPSPSPGVHSTASGEIQTTSTPPVPSLSPGVHSTASGEIQTTSTPPVPSPSPGVSTASGEPHTTSPPPVPSTSPGFSTASVESQTTSWESQTITASGESRTTSPLPVPSSSPGVTTANGKTQTTPPPPVSTLRTRKPPARRGCVPCWRRGTRKTHSDNCSAYSDPISSNTHVQRNTSDLCVQQTIFQQQHSPRIPRLSLF